MISYTIGSLHLVPALRNQNLLATKVVAILDILEANEIGVAEIDPALSDTAAFCQSYGIELKRAANCVVLEATRGDRSWFAACVILATTRADVNGLARKRLQARKVSFASMAKTVTQTGMEYGAITLVGLPSDWPILIDQSVVDSDYVIIGSGVRKSKIVISGRLLALLPNTQVLRGLGQAR